MNKAVEVKGRFQKRKKEMEVQRLSYDLQNKNLGRIPWHKSRDIFISCQQKNQEERRWEYFT